MPERDLDRIPAIQRLNRFAGKLPAELRQELYETAECFLCIGAGHGAFAGMASMLGTTSNGDQQKEYIAYLQGKATESKTPVAPPLSSLKGTPDLLSKPISVLGLSSSVEEFLVELGAKTIGELLECPGRALDATYISGVPVSTEPRAKLAELGLKLKGE